MRRTILAISTRSLRVVTLCIFFVFCTLYMLSSLVMPVYALGVSPGRIVVWYDPAHREQEFTLRVLDASSKATVSIQGDLASSVQLQGPDANGMVHGTLTLPSNLSALPPGDHSQIILISEPPGEQATVAAGISIASELLVRVPYPDQYLTGTLSAANDKSSSNTIMMLTLQNLGEKDAMTDVAYVRILDQQGQQEQHDAFVFEPTRVPSATYVRVVTTYTGLANSRIAPGEYDAVVDVRYGPYVLVNSSENNIGSENISLSHTGTLRIAQPITLGASSIAIERLEYPQEQGVIRPLDISGTLHWNRAQKANVQVFFDGANTPVLSQELELNNTFSTRIYLPIQQIGAPNSTITVRVSLPGGASETRTLLLIASSPASSNRVILMVGITLLVLLLVVVVLLFLRFKRVRANKLP